MQPFAFTLCADDFALSPGVSRGILAALEAGRLGATSVMTTRPSWPAFARDLRAFDGSVDIGLHLDLTCGEPLGPMPEFAPGGAFPDIFHLLRLARNAALPEAEIKAEIARQVDAFVSCFGAPPDFVDGHQHVQVFPQVRSFLFDCLEEWGLAGKIWLRDSTDRISRILHRRIEPTKALGIAWIGRGFAGEARRRGFVTNDGFAGFSRFEPARDYARDFERCLEAPGGRHLVMCHPGYCDAELAAVDEVTITREQELAFLLSPAFFTLLERRGARLVRFGAARP